MRITVAMNYDGGEDEQRECVVIHQRVESDENETIERVIVQQPLSVEHQTACTLEDVREGDIITFA